MVLDELILKKELGIRGLYTAWELRGKPCIRSDTSSAKKSIQVARSFGGALHTEEELRDPVAQFVGMAASELRRQGSLAGSVQVMIRTDWYDKEEYYSNMAVYRLPRAAANDLELVAAAFKVLHGIYREGLSYKKAGVRLGAFSSASAVQTVLFDEREGAPETSKRKILLSSIESINAEIGFRAVRPAIYWRAEEERPRWQPNQNWQAERNKNSEDKSGDIPSHSFRVHGVDATALGSAPAGR